MESHQEDMEEGLRSPTRSNASSKVEDMA